QVVCDDVKRIVHRRYSEFLTLHALLKDPFAIPPKRVLTTTFIPSAWIDNTLIDERKLGLSRYLNDLLTVAEYKTNPVLLNFLTNTGPASALTFNLEDAVPSTLSRKTAMDLIQEQTGDVKTATTMIAASYYPDWVSDSYPPESLDFSKFDIIFFAFATPSSSYGLAFDSGSQAVLKRLATAAHNSGYGTKVSLSIGS
ncbi:hypothetical protein H0H93_016404, partial [Arthromyces matolae]